MPNDSPVEYSASDAKDISAGIASTHNPNLSLPENIAAAASAIAKFASAARGQSG